MRNVCNLLSSSISNCDMNIATLRCLNSSTIELARYRNPGMERILHLALRELDDWCILKLDLQRTIDFDFEVESCKRFDRWSERSRCDNRWGWARVIITPSAIRQLWLDYWLRSTCELFSRFQRGTLLTNSNYAIMRSFKYSLEYHNGLCDNHYAIFHISRITCCQTGSWCSLQKAPQEPSLCRREMFRQDLLYDFKITQWKDCAICLRALNQDQSHHWNIFVAFDWLSRNVQ